MYRTITIDKTVEAERERYFLNKVNFACVMPNILNKNRIIKGRVILTYDFIGTG